MQRKSLMSILLLTISAFVTAQSLQTWTWGTYKMKFKAPSNMAIQQNDLNGFQASNNNITLNIYPRNGENLTYDGMKNAIINWANKASLSYNTTKLDGSTQPIYLENINRYWGCAIDGTKEGFGASALLLVNPDNPDISFYVWISYAKEYYHDAVAILRSFQPL